MTQTSALTGLSYPDGPDLVKTIPDTNIMFDRQLTDMVRIQATSVQDRDSRFPRLGINDRPVVEIAALDEIHAFDGVQWVISDTKKKTIKASDSMPLWYSGTDTLPLRILSGELRVIYQRLGRELWWQVHLRRGADSNVGSGYYSFFLPYPIEDWITATGTAMVRLTNGTEYGYTAAFRDAQRPIVMLNPGRLGTTTHSWQQGDYIGLSGLNAIGGYR